MSRNGGVGLLAACRAWRQWQNATGWFAEVGIVELRLQFTDKPNLRSAAFLFAARRSVRTRAFILQLASRIMLTSCQYLSIINWFERFSDPARARMSRIGTVWFC
ncbi:hypothetical protein CQ052_19415 [Ochrobactrum sp. MYb15]|nr:hypothetical protein CQZ90_21500 [Ochrobactrum sp. MYb19]PRA60548.1 hypothetical protein CQ053_21270 [Ochrobactrum sp. MYb18]PRA73528.1 hypothetical protein CQ049_20925 [Brucella thiophenivorans]PRA84689.1 hypothetical protein CQ051_21510 [Ochrobactrum sp. MYb14]PRA94583.1 hypothetical protein CQ052_19415 [Ochrobactrum sp. MYb15]